MRYLYVSYPEKDYVFAHRLIDDLQAAGYVVFSDAVTAAGSMAWATETRRAIRASGAVLMILTPADGRRVGTRHEGVLAIRGQKPLMVLRRSPGELPRFGRHGVEIDFTGEYDRAFQRLLSELPTAAALLTAPPARLRRMPRRPPHQPPRRQRRIAWTVGILGLLAVCLLIGIAFGLIPV